MQVLGAIDIAKEYLRCEQFLLDAINLNNGLFKSENILEDLINHKCQLFVSDNSALVTTINNHPNKSVLHLFLAGGNLQELEKLYLEAEEYARYMNCKVITLMGRFGWKKSFLTKYGMKPTCLQMSKEL